MSRRSSPNGYAWWPRLFSVYASLYHRKWGRPYLTRAFFDAIPTVLGERAVIAVARDPSRPADDAVVAMALSFERGSACFGRSWGSAVDVPGLHFELCYYALIERAIARKQVLVDAGAQGEHKLKRGYLPVLTHSVHRFADPRLHPLVARFFIDEEGRSSRSATSSPRTVRSRTAPRPRCRSSPGCAPIREARRSRC